MKRCAHDTMQPTGWSKPERCTSATGPRTAYKYLGIHIIYISLGSDSVQDVHILDLYASLLQAEQDMERQWQDELEDLEAQISALNAQLGSQCRGRRVRTQKQPCTSAHKHGFPVAHDVPLFLQWRTVVCL